MYANIYWYQYQLYVCKDCDECLAFMHFHNCSKNEDERHQFDSNILFKEENINCTHDEDSSASQSMICEFIKTPSAVMLFCHLPRLLI